MADNVFRVTTIAQMYGQQCQNVLHFSGPSSDPNQLQALALDVIANWINLVKQRVSGDLVWNQVQVRLLSSQFATHNETISIGGTAGTSNQLWGVHAFILRIRAATIGRSSRGRVYIPGVLPGQMQAGFWQASTVQAWFNITNAVMEAYGPGGTSPFRLGIAPKVNSTANFKEAVSLQLGPLPGVQRRRQVGIGI